MTPTPVARAPNPAWPRATAIGLGDESGDDVNEDTCMIQKMSVNHTHMTDAKATVCVCESG